MSTSKHFHTQPGPLVSSALASLTHTNPSLCLDAANKIIYHLPTAQSGKVAVVSGGGSGHEPSFSGLVGKGLLCAGVAGTIFASPSAEQVRRCITKLGQEEGKDGKGVLVVVMNYTGDVLNFGMAVEKARAAGVPIEMVVVGDDVGVGRAKAGKVGRRGIAGTVMVVKAVGAASEKGASLSDVHKVAQQVSSNLISVGASLAHVHVPGRPADEGDTLAADEIELGMGIHNEPGSERLRGADLSTLVQTMLTRMLDSSDTDRAFLSISSADSVVALINNLGGVSPLEFGAITHEVLTQLKSTFQIEPVRVLAGTYMTSLNGPGFSISLLRVQDTGLGSGMQILDLLDAPVEVPGWTPAVGPATWALPRGREIDTVPPTAGETRDSGISIDPARARSILTAGLQRLVAAEPEVTRYDTVAGDGDCGIGLKRGAEAVLALLGKPQVQQIGDLCALLDRIVGVVEENMDGTSGALYAIFLNALNHGLRVQGSKHPGEISIETHVTPALDSALGGLERYTPAKVGDRTLMDALSPFVTGLEETKDVKAAAGRAREGAESTKGMTASLGRTVYVGGEDWKGVPDPGAWGLSEFFLGLGEGISN